VRDERSQGTYTTAGVHAEAGGFVLAPRPIDEGMKLPWELIVTCIVSLENKVVSSTGFKPPLFFLDCCDGCSVAGEAV